MTWRHVLRRDLVSARRSRLLPAVFLSLFVLTGGLIALMLWLSDPAFPPDTSDAVYVLSSVVNVVVPLVALLAAYGAIVGERTAGSVRFLLGLPNSRLDAYAGKYLGRGLIVALPLGAGLLASAVLVAVGFEGGSATGIVALGVLSTLYALVFVGVGLALSAWLPTDASASGAAVGVYVVLRVGWPALQFLGLRMADVAAAPPFPEWYFWLGRINPVNAYVATVEWLLPRGSSHPLLSRPRGVDTVATTPEFGLAVLVVWAVAAPAAGYLVFRRSDLL